MGTYIYAQEEESLHNGRFTGHYKSVTYQVASITLPDVVVVL